MTAWRAAAASLAISLLATAQATAQGQTDFPNRRIHVIVQYPAGGIVDIVTRIMTDKLSALWGQPIVVEAKPGANSNLGTDFVARAEPDGYTWCFMGPALMANPRIYSQSALDGEELRRRRRYGLGTGRHDRQPRIIRQDRHGNNRTGPSLRPVASTTATPASARPCT